ncbi:MULTISPECIES: DUF423 domain-containing protein [unclassified Pedobacter]|jgi:uncharacterized membrane protein YgdD (TMEM256/DUF423 family)|uniref:DUF423 domain-containing protein n=1 Tax=Pedobacter TaxID=84567 RepID=UPI000B4BA4F8|nr:MULTISPECIES: DUF423 domain-containing protein [unclassified Pedobacter]MCX2429730.1 DUF423 domain-containing protein [Pedobacter sp. GR22-10]MCX2585382.1 DUF423 domain-containing protein [Pedobacter sp. MR22-3]OWK70798.1 hypothetical protein CBW18_06765 [Pedobacter sp. AJM]
MNKRIILTASFFGLVAVLLGAFGAHALKALVDASALEIWQKGVSYQFYHTFALLYLSTFARYRNKLINIAYFCFTFGIILFSGSLYLLATRSILQLDFVNLIGPLTPIGGLLFVLGWIMLFFAAFKDK